MYGEIVEERGKDNLPKHYAFYLVKTYPIKNEQLAGKVLQKIQYFPNLV